MQVQMKVLTEKIWWADGTSSPSMCIPNGTKFIAGLI